MAQRKHNPEAYQPLPASAEVIAFRRRAGEAVEPSEVSPVQFYLEHWSLPTQQDSELAQAIVSATDPTDHSGGEPQERLRAALLALEKHDYYDEVREVDDVLRSLENSTHSSAGNGLTMERKALLALIDIRILDVVEDPEKDLPDQLGRLPLGNEELWYELMKRL